MWMQSASHLYLAIDKHNKKEISFCCSFLKHRPKLWSCLCSTAYVTEDGRSLCEIQTAPLLPSHQATPSHWFHLLRTKNVLGSKERWDVVGMDVFHFRSSSSWKSFGLCSLGLPSMNETSLVWWEGRVTILDLIHLVNLLHSFCSWVPVEC